MHHSVSPALRVPDLSPALHVPYSLRIPSPSESTAAPPLVVDYSCSIAAASLALPRSSPSSDHASTLARVLSAAPVPSGPGRRRLLPPQPLIRPAKAGNALRH